MATSRREEKLMLIEHKEGKKGRGDDDFWSGRRRKGTRNSSREDRKKIARKGKMKIKK